MNHNIIVPVVMFLCVTYAFKITLEAVMRNRMLRMGGSDEIVRTILQGEEQQRRLGGLRRGITLLAVAAGFALIGMVGWRDVTPGVIAILMAAAGVGNLAYFAASRRIG